jgi:hypothetical protein
MPHILLVPIQGSFNPFARDTENASIARPAPSAMLITKNPKSIKISSFLFFSSLVIIPQNAPFCQALFSLLHFLKKCAKIKKNRKKEERYGLPSMSARM